MLQCRVWGRDTGNAGEWEALTQGTQGKKTERSVAPYLLRVSARFLLSALLPIYMGQLKFEWGQSMACVKSGVVFPGCRSTICVALATTAAPVPKLTKYAAQYTWFFGTDRSWIGTQVVKRPKYLPSLCTFLPNFLPNPNRQANAERIVNWLSNACLRSQDGGVGAGICLRKVKWKYLAGRGMGFSRGRPALESNWYNSSHT